MTTNLQVPSKVTLTQLWDNNNAIEQVTFRQLLSMNSGVKDYYFDQSNWLYDQVSRLSSCTASWSPSLFSRPLISCCFLSYRKPSFYQLYNQVTSWHTPVTAAQLYSTASSSNSPHTVAAHSASSSRHFALNIRKVRINTYASSHFPYQHIHACHAFVLNTYTSTQIALNTCN